MCAGSKEIIISAKDQLAMTYKIGVSQIVTFLKLFLLFSFNFHFENAIVG